MGRSCKDCKFSKPDNSLFFVISDLFGCNNRWRFAYCTHKAAKKTNKHDLHHLGASGTKINCTSCFIARNDYGSATICGPEARLFEPIR